MMTQAQISGDETSSSAKLMLGIKEKVELDRYAIGAQAANKRQICGSSTY